MQINFVENTIEPCQVFSLAFAEQSIALDYFIGTGEKKIKLPEVTQTPDCGLSLNDIRISDAVSGTLEKEAIMPILNLDFESSSLEVMTDDLSLSHNTIILKVVPVLSEVKQEAIKALSIILTMVPQTPHFEMK